MCSTPTHVEAAEMRGERRRGERMVRSLICILDDIVWSGGSEGGCCDEVLEKHGKCFYIYTTLLLG
jgi:hypothetical protein